MTRNDAGRGDGAARAALAATYEFEAEVGRGASGVVYRARRRSDGLGVAIKILRDEIASGVGGDRFIREIAIESQLAHANIAEVVESGAAEGLPYLVVRFAPEGSLRDRLEREGELPLASAIAIARDVAAALDCAGAQRIVHRDVKPENILLAGDGAVLTDFGIARVIGEAAGERLTESGVTVGTPAYMSPEQAAGERNLDPRSDQYALACVVHEMLSGDPPFSGRSTRAVAARHTHEPPPSVRIVRPTVPTGVEYALLRALSKSPADRFATAGEFVRALQSEAPAGWTGPREAHLVAAARRKRNVLAGLVAVAVTGVAVALWLRPTLPASDRNKVVLFPLVDIERPMESVGLGVSLAMAQSLMHAVPLIGLDGWTYLEPEARADARLVTARVARDVARRRGAQFYVTGNILRTGDSATVSLQLFDAVGDSLAAQERATGTSDLPSVVQAGAQAYAQLLPRLLDPGRRVDVSFLLNRSKSSLALWIQGEVAYRQAHFAQALDLLQRAVAEDSAFAMAALRGAQAASWLSDAELASRLVAVAMVHDSLLAPGHAALARGFAAYLAGAADSAVHWLSRAVELTATGAEAPMLLGEVYYHLLPADWAGDSTSARLFALAVARDTAFTPPLVHLAEMALRAGETRSAGRFITRLRETEPDTTFLRELLLMQRCVGGSSMDWLAAARTSPTAVSLASHQLAAAGLQTRCAEQAFRATLAVDSAPRSPDRWHAVIGLQGLLGAQGRTADIRTLIADEVRRGRAAATLLYVLNNEAGNAMPDKEAEFVAAVRALSGDDFGRRPALTQWALALAFARQRDTTRVRAIAASLAHRADSTKVRADSLFARAIAAHRLLLAGDTASALRVLGSLRPSARPPSLIADLFEPLEVERMLLARLLVARGDRVGAMRVATSFDNAQSVASLMFLYESLQIRAKAGDAAVSRDAVRRARALRGSASGIQ